MLVSIFFKIFVKMVGDCEFMNSLVWLRCNLLLGGPKCGSEVG